MVHQSTHRPTHIYTQPNPTPGPEKTARFLAQILISLCKSLGLFAHTYEDLTFGVDSYPPRPYRDIVRMYVALCMCECMYMCGAYRADRLTDLSISQVAVAALLVAPARAPLRLSPLPCVVGRDAPHLAAPPPPPQRQRRRRRRRWPARARGQEDQVMRS